MEHTYTYIKKIYYKELNIAPITGGPLNLQTPYKALSVSYNCSFNFSMIHINLFYFCYSRTLYWAMIVKFD